MLAPRRKPALLCTVDVFEILLMTISVAYVFVVVGRGAGAILDECRDRPDQRGRLLGALAARMTAYLASFNHNLTLVESAGRTAARRVEWRHVSKKTETCPRESVLPASATSYIPSSTCVLPGQLRGPGQPRPRPPPSGDPAPGAGALPARRLFPWRRRERRHSARGKKRRGPPPHGCARQDRAPPTGGGSGSSRRAGTHSFIKRP